jgi:predicted oxidoreductase (fatty acid repression mutant protein)
VDIKDAEYQDWKEDSYNYNKPKISFFTKKPLNNTKILAQDWWLKPMLKANAVWSHHKGRSGGYISDYKSVGRDVRVIGTELQLYNLFCKMSDEKGWQIKDEWSAEVKKEYLNLYIKNNLKPLIINI